MNCLVVPANGSAIVRAKEVAASLSLPYGRRACDVKSKVLLIVDHDRAWLQLQSQACGPVHIDFTDPRLLFRRKSGHNEPLGRAVGVKGNRRPHVLDATAGLGRDAFVLADLGCQVTLSERSTILAFLLNEACSFAALSANKKVMAAINRMKVVVGDTKFYEIEGEQVIYLDPMFPPREKSAAVKKELVTLQELHCGQIDDSKSLVDWAFSQPNTRVVAKRPRSAPAISDRKPAHSLLGKTIRFDVYTS